MPPDYSNVFINRFRIARHFIPEGTKRAIYLTVAKTNLEECCVLEGRLLSGRMNWSLISKSPESWLVLPNLLDHERTRKTFVWDDIRHELDGLPGRRGLNIAYEG